MSNPESFTLGQQDIDGVQKAINHRLGKKGGASTWLFCINFAAWIFIGIACAGFYDAWQDDSASARPFLWMVLCAVAGFAAAMAIPWVGQRVASRHLVDPQGSFMSPQTAAIENGMLVIRTMTGRSEFLWHAIQGRISDERNHYLFIDGAQAIVLPKTVGEALGPEFAARLAQMPDESPAAGER